MKKVVARAEATISTTTKKPLAPRSVLAIHNIGRVLFNHALDDQIVSHNPFNLRARRRELPKKRDADPTWRSKSIYTRTEIAALITAESVADDRRVSYAVQYFAGLRPDEALSRRFADWEPDASPLGKLVVETQRDGRELKTQAPRDVPVHPVLARILERWHTSGFELVYGRPPSPEDFITPSRQDVSRPKSKKTWDRLKQDLKRLQLREEGRARHAFRRSFISHAREDGAPRDLLEVITHAGRGDVFSGYTTFAWPVLCEAVAKLDLRSSEPLLANTVGASAVAGHVAEPDALPAMVREPAVVAAAMTISVSSSAPPSAHRFGRARRGGRSTRPSRGGGAHAGAHAAKEEAQRPEIAGLREAGWTGLEPAASGVTGRRYNQLNYHPVVAPCFQGTRDVAGTSEVVNLGVVGSR